MPSITVKALDGSVSSIASYAGQSVMEALRDEGVEGIHAICGGLLSCATCHVFVDDAFLSLLEPMTEEEDDLLGSARNRRSNSRLSCQLEMTDDLDGLSVAVAPEDLVADKVAAPSRRWGIVRGGTLSRGTFVSRDLDGLARFADEVLGLEPVRLGPDRLGLRDRRTGEGAEPFWLLEAVAADQIERPQSMLNHWGLTVDTMQEVDDAYAFLTANQERYGIGRFSKPRDQHGSYSFYMGDADSNFWEIEYRAPGLRYDELRDMATGGDNGRG